MQRPLECVETPRGYLLLGKTHLKRRDYGMADDLHLTVIIKDDGLRTKIGTQLACSRGQEHIRTFRTREEFDQARFGGRQLFHVDGVIVAQADAPTDLATHIGKIQESAPSARIIVVRTPGEALRLSDVACNVVPLDRKFSEHVDRALQLA